MGVQSQQMFLSIIMQSRRRLSFDFGVIERRTSYSVLFVLSFGFMPHSVSFSFRKVKVLRLEFVHPHMSFSTNANVFISASTVGKPRLALTFLPSTFSYSYHIS